MRISRRLLVLLAMGAVAAGGIARGAEQLLAQGSSVREGAGGRLWVAQVQRDPQRGEPGKEVTRIRHRLAGSGTWDDLARMSGAPVVELAHRGAELVVRLETGEWMFVWESGRSSGSPLPGQGKIVTFGSVEDPDGGALWAIGRVNGGMAALATRPATTTRASATSPSTQTTQPALAPRPLLPPVKLVLFSLNRSKWEAQAEMPAETPDADAKMSMVVGDDNRVVIATATDNGVKTSEWTNRGGWTSTGTIPLADSVSTFKLLWANDKPMLWAAGPAGAGSLHIFQDGRWSDPVELRVAGADLSQALPRDVAVFSSLIRFIYSKGGKVYDQHFFANGSPKDDPEEVRAPATLQDSRVNTWMQVAVTVALVFVVFGTVRRRRSGEAAEFDQRKVTLAPLLPRLAAGTVDALPVIVALFIVASRAGQTENPTRIELSSLVPVGIAAIIYFLHTLITELITDRTLGKMIFGLRVVGMDGQRPSRGAIVVRNVVRIIEVWVFFLLLMVFVSPLRQRAGDLIAGTVVVEKKRDRSDEETD